MTDFLITFSVDGTAAIRMMEEIGRRATALEARLNALGRGTGSGGGITGGILNTLGGRGASSPLSSITQGLQTSIARFREVSAAAQQMNTHLGAGAYKTAAINAQVLANRLGATSSQYARLTGESRTWLAMSKEVANKLDDTGQAFGRHARRVFEGILIYEAFGRAVQAVSAGVELIVDIDRESRRLEAVLDISPTQGAQFIQDLGKIASDTVTPFADLVSEADRMASAFLDIEDPAQRAAAAIKLADDAGKFTTVTQRGLGVEVNNLIAIMKQLNIPVDDLGNVLGKIVTAGGNSSVVIADLADALQLASRSIALAGESLGPEKFGGFLDIVIALMSEFRIQTGRTGNAVGNTFAFLFSRITDPDNISALEEITGGLLKMRDAAGTIRDPISIMLELNALLKTGSINATQFADFFDKLTLLNPQAKPDLLLISQLLDKIGPSVAKIGAADSSALDNLVNKINDALGPQFQKLIIDAQRAFVELFGPGILSGGQMLIDVLRAIGKALGALPPGLIQTVALFGSLLISWRLLAFIGKGLGSILGISAIGLAKTGTASAGAATSMTLFGRAAVGTRIALVGLLSQLKILAPLVAAFMAIDFVSTINKAQEGLRTQIGDQLVGKNLADLKAFREKLISQLSDFAQERIALGKNPLVEGFDPIGAIRQISDLKTFTTDPAILESLKEVDALILKIGESGSEVSLDDLTGRFKAAADATDEEKQEIEDLNNLLDELKAQAEGSAAGIASMTKAERQAAEAAVLLTSLVDEQGDKLLELNDRLKDGKINATEWTQGQDEIARAAEAASQLVAAMGDKLRDLIPELGGAAEGNEALASALFDVFINSSDALPVIEANVALIIKLAQAAGIAAVSLAAMARAQELMIRAEALAASSDSWDALGPDNPFNIAYRSRVLLSGSTTTSAGDAAAQISRAISQILGAIRTGGSSTFGVGGGGSTSSFSQTPVLDLGELDASTISQIIAIATTLRNAIPGETAASVDDVVALIKDASFLQNVKGIDERLLRIAIEELTEQMEEANRLKQQEQILQNLVVNTGPLSALVSQPTTFGVGGSLASGTGLNFDPTKGNFTINVPIELSGLDPAGLQQLVYNIIYKAIQDALRL